MTSRSVALEAVRRVTDEGAYSSLVIPSLLAGSDLDARDRAFAAELAYGTLRRLIPIDVALEARASRSVSRMSAGVRTVLRLGAYQLLFAHVAPHAAVGETVSLAGAKERGFANAVLRRLAAEPPAPPAGIDDAAVSARTGLQRWAVTELRRIVGDEEIETAASAFATRGALCLRVNTCVAHRERVVGALRDAGHDPTPAEVDADCLILEGGDPASMPGFAEGWFAVQDQASAFVVRALDPQPGERVLDVCAAPGGKALLAGCSVEPGGVVVAADRTLSRARLIAGQARRLRGRPRIVVQDATAPAIRGPFDRVLVDAPCSGIGSARRRPELLWRVPRDRLSPLARTQVAIAVAATDQLRRGGRLVYSVCTFPRAETEAAVGAILRHRQDLHPIETPGPDGPSTQHRLWPHRHGSDGMFVAAFERT